MTAADPTPAALEALAALQVARDTDEAGLTSDVAATRIGLAARLARLTVPQLAALHVAVYGWPPRLRAKGFAVARLTYWATERSHARESIAY